MGLLDFFRGQRKPERDPPAVAVDRDEAGDVVFSDDLVSHIKDELEKRRTDRALYELQWTLNANFLAGNQNCDIDLIQNTIKAEEPVGGELSERRCFNRIAPLMDTRLANLMSVKYDMVVLARTTEAEDAAKAKVSTKLLEYCQNVTEFDRQMNDLLSWCELTGTAFTVSYWDKNKGEVIGKLLVQSDDPTVEPVEQDIYVGDLAFGLLSPYEIFPESLNVQNVADQHDIIVEQVFDVDTIRDMYGVDIDPDKVVAYELVPQPKGMTGHGVNNVTSGVSRVEREGCQKVITYYERPTGKYPQGRMAVVIGDRLAYYGVLPCGEYPIREFKSKERPGLFFGVSPIEALIPLQRTYNELQNKILDYAEAVVNAAVIAPTGSVDVDRIEYLGGVTPGMLLEYNGQFGKPEYMQPGAFPDVIVRQRDQIAQDMEYTAGVSQLMVYGSAASSSSGKALDTRREIDMTRMSLTADNIRDGVIAMAKLWLRINKAYSVGYRTLQIAGSDEMGDVYTWCADDINSYDIEFSAENELRHSRDQQREDFLQAFQLGLFTDENGRIPQEIKRRAWELFRFGDMHDIMDIDDIQRKNAQRENAYLESGVIPNEIEPFDDSEIHLNEHVRFVLSNDFRLFKQKNPEYAKLFEEHIKRHKELLEQQNQNRMMSALTAAGGKQ